MITDIQRKFLAKVIGGEVTKEDNPKRYSAVMGRIQEHIDKELLNLIWLVDNCPDVLKDEETEINNGKLERFRRFKVFAYIFSKLDPTTNIENIELVDIIKKLSQLYPKYYFELIRKGK